MQESFGTIGGTELFLPVGKNSGEMCVDCEEGWKETQSSEWGNTTWIFSWGEWRCNRESLWVADVVNWGPAVYVCMYNDTWCETVVSTLDIHTSLSWLSPTDIFKSHVGFWRNPTWDLGGIELEPSGATAPPLPPLTTRQDWWQA